jgi:Nuclease-related domain
VYGGTKTLHAATARGHRLAPTPVAFVMGVSPAAPLRWLSFFDGQQAQVSIAPQAQTATQVFHDVPGEGFNIDHVAIGPAGVFTIETKTRSKPEGRRVRTVVDRAGISIAGAPPSHGPLDQASAQANWLAELLRRSTSKPYRVRPVVLFPGWFVAQKRPRKPSDPWVLEPKAFVKWLERERVQLTDEQIALASAHLSLYLRREWDSRTAVGAV